MASEKSSAALEQKFVIGVIAAYLNDESGFVLPEGIDWNELYAFVQKQGINNIFCYSLQKYGIVPGEAIKDDLAEYFDQFVTIEAVQEIEITELSQRFSDAGIDHMPLKGYILKNLYPLPDMREMCDVDILVHPENFPEVRRIMSECEYEFELESEHEIVFKKEPFLTVEIHKCLVPPYNDILFGYYGDGWRYGKESRETSHLYEMSQEDFYVYNVAHTAKHYLNSGIGVRQVLDVWMMDRNMTGLDREYIEEQLKKLQIDKFHGILTDLTHVWFDGEKTRYNAVDTMEEYILSGAQFGDEVRKKISHIYKNTDHGDYRKGIVKRLKTVVFPGVETMSFNYPVLKKHPALYPVIVIYNIFYRLFGRRKETMQKMKLYTKHGADVERFAKHCEEVGISNRL